MGKIRIGRRKINLSPDDVDGFLEQIPIIGAKEIVKRLSEHSDPSDSVRCFSENVAVLAKKIVEQLDDLDRTRLVDHLRAMQAEGVWVPARQCLDKILERRKENSLGFNALLLDASLGLATNAMQVRNVLITWLQERANIQGQTPPRETYDRIELSYRLYSDIVDRVERLSRKSEERRSPH
jgi:hypothetical protein